MNALDYFFEHSEGRRTAILYDDRCITYGELIERVRGTAAVLRANGLELGDHVAILADNSLFWVQAYLGTLHAGGVAVPLQSTMTPAELPPLLSWLECQFVFAQPKRLDLSTLSILRQTVVFDDQTEPSGLCVWRTGTERTEVRQRKLTSGLAALMLTSGSTASPRAVMVSHRNIVANTESVIQALRLDAEHRMLCVMPFSYCFSASLLHTHLRIGGSLALYKGVFSPARSLTELNATRCTSLAGIPSVFQVLLRSRSFAAHFTPSLRHIQQSGGRLAPAFIRALQEAVPSAQIHIMYGQTEATARLTVLPAERLGDKAESVGLPIPGVQIAIVDKTGGRCPDGQAGEITATGDNVALGYWRDEAASSARFRNGVLHTGDIGFRDEEGFLYIVDREEDFIKASGHRFSAQQVEDCISALDGVVEVAVVGIPHTTLGEAVKAYIVMKPGAQVTPAMVVLRCRSTLPHYMAPREIAVVAELPKNSAGKVLKSVLRRLE